MSERTVGWRSSEYGLQQQEQPSYWVNVARSYASRMSARLGGVWVIGEILGEQGTSTYLSFPSETSYPNIQFATQDLNENYLTAFDASGVEVWLQVEPADADISTLIDLVIGRYKHHPCVKGFGVDVEWYQIANYTDGRQVSDAEAQTWLTQVKSHNPAYKLFLKHWLPEKMPSIRPQDLVFISDSTEFSTLEQQIAEFTVWGNQFTPNTVGFQIGYPIDKPWWSQLTDPPISIANAIFSAIPNCKEVYWVDFSIKDVLWPSGDNGTISEFPWLIVIPITALAVLGLAYAIHRLR